jgi:UDP-N-acetylmuramate dehydrogenase
VPVELDVPLAPLTTLGLGGPAGRLVRCATDPELREALAAADADGAPALLLGGGSNVVIADDGVPGTVVRCETRGVAIERAGEGRVVVRVAAGEPWDPLVERTVAEGLSGLECLSGIPGSTGATPIQNVGAYGQEVAQTLAWVRVLDRATGDERRLHPGELGLGYRTSALKHQDRLAVLEVAYALEERPEGAPVAYAELARTLGVEPGARPPLAEAREAVLGLRRGKGMVLDPDDPDTRSAGSFFTNPVLDAAAWSELAARAPAEPPRFPASDGQVKTSAAWLIERAGFTRGYARGRAALSSKHTLALTNHDGATTAELVALAREIRDGVRERFGVTLVPEPVLVGVSLD